MSSKGKKSNSSIENPSRKKRTIVVKNEINSIPSLKKSKNAKEKQIADTKKKIQIKETTIPKKIMQVKKTQRRTTNRTVSSTSSTSTSVSKEELRYMERVAYGDTLRDILKNMWTSIPT